MLPLSTLKSHHQSWRVVKDVIKNTLNYLSYKRDLFLRMSSITIILSYTNPPDTHQFHKTKLFSMYILCSAITRVYRL